MPLHRLVLALSTLFLACLPLAADDELEAKLKALTAAIGGSGVPDEFIKLRADFEHRSPPVDAEEKKLIARYAAEIDAALAARTIRVMRVTLSSSTLRRDSLLDNPTSISPPQGLGIEQYLPGLRDAIAAAAKDNGVCELQFRPAFGPKEAAATWKNLRASIIETYVGYTTASRNSEGRTTFVGVLPHELKVQLLFDGYGYDAPNSWTHPLLAGPGGRFIDAGEHPDIIIVGEGVPLEVDQDGFDALRSKTHQELIQRLTSKMASFPRLEFFPGIDRKSLALRSADNTIADPMRIKAMVLFEPERLKAQLADFWPQATVAEEDKVAGPLIESNYTPAAPQIIERLSQFTANGLEELAKGLQFNSGYANHSLLLALARHPDYKVFQISWLPLIREPKLFDLQKETASRVRNFADPRWPDYLTFYLQNFGSKGARTFDDLIFPPTDPKVSEQYLKIFVRSAGNDNLQGVANDHYLQVTPALREQMLQRLHEVDDDQARLLEVSRRLLEKGDARTPAENTQFARLAQRYSTVRKAVRAAAAATRPPKN